MTLPSARVLSSITLKMNSGSTPTGGSTSYQASGTPLVRSLNVRDGFFSKEGLVFLDDTQAYKLRNAEIAPGDVLLNITGASVARACSAPRELAGARVNQHVMILRPDCSQVSSSYLAAYLCAPKTQSELLLLAGSGATREALTKEQLETLLIPLPPLDEQRRIAAILDQADALRDKRRQALAQVEQLTQSVFLEMFGDPAVNSKGWPTATIGEMGRVLTGNTPSRQVPDFYGDHLEWIKSDNLNHSGRHVTRASEYLSSEGARVGRLVPAGSVLVTCIAGSRECIGNASITDRTVAFNQQINAIVPERVNGEFLLSQILVGKRLIQANSTDSMKGIVTKARFEAIRLMLPPLDLQQDFARRVEAIERLKDAHRRSLEEMDALFASLQHRAFRGEL